MLKGEGPAAVWRDFFIMPHKIDPAPKVHYNIAQGSALEFRYPIIKFLIRSEGAV
jgi:hypothetical protein